MAYTGPSIVDYLNSTGQASDFKSRSVLAQQKGIQNYTGTAEQNTQLLGILRTPTPAPTTNAPIGANTLGQTNTQPITVTPFQQQPVVYPEFDYKTTLAAANKEAEQMYGSTAQDQAKNTLQGQIESLITKQGQQSARNAELETQQLAPLNKQLNEVGAQMQQLDAEYKQFVNTQEDRLAPTFTIYGAQDQAQRKFAVKKAGLAAQAAFIQGNISLAQQNIARALEAEFGGIENELKYKMFTFENAKDELAKIDQKRATYVENKLKAEYTKVEEAKKTKEEVYKIYAEIAGLGKADNFTLEKIRNAASPFDAIKIAADAGVYSNGKKLESQLVKLDNGNTVLVNTQTGDVIKNLGGRKPDGTPLTITGDATKYAGALNVILGSTKLTEPQKKTLIDSVNSGEDPVAILKNQAKQAMTAVNQTKVENYEAAKDALKSVADGLDAYYKAGGDTNFFKGNYEKVLNKAGTFSDPELVQLATQIQQSLQIYRNSVSGTAYSVQEGADIASIFPGINKTSGLNNAIIAGRMKAFSDGVDGAYRSVLGSTYDQLKPFEQTETIRIAPNGDQVIIID